MGGSPYACRPPPPGVGPHHKVLEAVRHLGIVAHGDEWKGDKDEVEGAQLGQRRAAQVDHAGVGRHEQVRNDDALEVALRLRREREGRLHARRPGEACARQCDGLLEALCAQDGRAAVRGWPHDVVGHVDAHERVADLSERRRCALEVQVHPLLVFARRKIPRGLVSSVKPRRVARGSGSGRFPGGFAGVRFRRQRSNGDAEFRLLRHCDTGGQRAFSDSGTDARRGIWSCAAACSRPLGESHESRCTAT